ncbi:MAG TPA: hypothetical protein VEP49_02235 [Acidimicrobiia bacterium]|nr:hypothetical protein [Acidimicrobiia bacterium]
MTRRTVTLPGVEPRAQLDAALADVRHRLTAEFPELPAARVAETVAKCAARWADVRVTEFVPLLTERESRRRLREVAAATAALRRSA